MTELECEKHYPI